ncbi:MULTISPECIES: C40 family peptidase [unclassified Paenibacillus]|uniref:C40 family peptidase n=1 Tax=unclassified Paenibacillus TaxID=185978 RepID=UPI001AE2C34A|nr:MULTISPECIES: C40 family peptidase [unclassified Paenibacillus]MBP1157094.1 cell wall-associated NlpC family hydrolase [Paenibacillus sp. PvP091]MBP1172167.1 cell wall-associated NlpC family hydrolase [Paenibacillus sp. PvR098]MBP2438548.1 cell wall-associated NlpC family hydrolase [Paenibacillus sp. PvP052]
MKKKLIVLLLSATVTLTAVPFQALAFSTDAQKIQIVKSVNFREQPSTSGTRIRYLKPGELLDPISVHNENWLKVRDASGKTGYVSSSSAYVQMTTVQVKTESNASIRKSVSFRTGPSTGESRIRYLREGESVLILEKVNAYWYKIQDTNDHIGYVSTHSQYIETHFESTQEPEEELFQSAPNATIVSSVSFRTTPSADAPRIRYIQKGEMLLVLDKPNDHWYNVQDKNGTIGYVSTSSKYISTTYVEPYKQLPQTIAAQKVIDAGKNYLGVPYEFSSNRSDTSTFDCSDFVRQSYIDGVGQILPGDSRSQGSYVKSVGKTSSDWHNLKPGDLLFFMSYKGSNASNYTSIDKSTEKITHVGIYLGDGQILHTYSVDSGGVRIDHLAGTPWEYRFLFGGSTY